MQSVAQLSHVKTLQGSCQGSPRPAPAIAHHVPGPRACVGAGRGRAWVCFALVEKKLEEYLRALTDMPDNDMPSWYAPPRQRA